MVGFDKTMPLKDTVARRAYQQQYHIANGDRLRSRRNKRYQSDPVLGAKQQREWRKNNPERAKAIDRRGAVKHRVARNRNNCEWKKNHPEARRRYHKNWYDQNLLRARKIFNAYRIRKRAAVGFHTLEQWIARVDYYGWRCAYCKRELNEKTLTQDHVIPITKGGSEWAANLVPACGSCNSSKGNKSLSEFMLLRRFDVNILS